MERYFVHGVGECLDEPFVEVGRIGRGSLAWAPCVIEKDQNNYMFYGHSPTSLAVSFDMYEWVWNEGKIELIWLSIPEKLRNELSKIRTKERR